MTVSHSILLLFSLVVIGDVHVDSIQFNVQEQMKNIENEKL